MILLPTFVFLGVETQQWSLAQFQDAARYIHSLGIDTVFVKCADGTNTWYGNSKKTIFSSILSIGVKPIAYTYCYGNAKGSSLDKEIDILIQLMKEDGIVVADMESEFNGQIAEAKHMSDRLKQVPATFGITTWADPNLQSWNDVLNALRPCVNFWLPQVYTNFLATIYHKQFDPLGLPYYPILYLGNDLGPNDITTIANTSNSPVIGFWEYTDLKGYENTVKKIVTHVKGNAMKVPDGWAYNDKDKTLIAPNGVQVTLGFCQWVLTHSWDADNYPLMAAMGLNPVEQGNTTLGSGTVQAFRKKVLAWTPSRNVYEMWVGQEYLALYHLLSKSVTQLKEQKGPISKDALDTMKQISGNLETSLEALNAVITHFTS